MHDIIRDFSQQNGFTIRFVKLDTGNTRDQRYKHPYKQEFLNNWYLYESKRFNAPYSVVLNDEVIDVYDYEYCNKLLQRFNVEKFTMQNINNYMTNANMNAVIPLMLVMMRDNRINRYDYKYILDNGRVYEVGLHQHLNSVGINTSEHKITIKNILNMMIQILYDHNEYLQTWLTTCNQYILYKSIF